MAITGNWPLLFSSNIDYGFVHPNGKAYFFKGTLYDRYDITTDQVDAGYPVPIVGNWAGVPF